MIEIKIPATSANMGPGYDCLGIALTLYNHFFIEEIENGLEWEGCEVAFQNEDNLIYTAMKKCFEKIGYTPTGIKIKLQCDIPVSRGLGSSAACILGGIIGANEIAGGILNEKEILELASEMEGHPDNIAPALLGGMIVSIEDGDHVYYDRIPIAKGLKFCALIPEFTLSTAKARAVLPSSIPFSDGTFNVGRTALLITALVNGNFDLLHLGSKDKLHQNYRGTLIENYGEIVEKCRELNSLGVFLSGAGPTIMVILKEEDSTFCKEMGTYLSSLKDKWSIAEFMPNFDGAVVRDLQKND